MSQKKKNRIMFSWIFPEITLLSHIYDIDWFNNIIKSYVDMGGINTLDFVNILLKRLNPLYNIQDALVVESYLLSIAIGDEPYLENTSLEYLNNTLDEHFEDLLNDSRRGHIRVFDNKSISTQDFNKVFSDHIYRYLQTFRKNFYSILGKQNIKVITIGRNVIIEHDGVDNCTIMETILQCSKINGIQFLPHII